MHGVFLIIAQSPTGELIYWTQYSWTFSGPNPAGAQNPLLLVGMSAGVPISASASLVRHTVQALHNLRGFVDLINSQ